MQALILAAGDGGRLYPMTSETPKPLLELRGRPIIRHVLDALAAAGVDDSTVVVGHRAKQLRDALQGAPPAGMRLRLIENEAYLLGNARSLWAARDVFAGPFVLAMADHVVEPAIIQATVDGANARCRVAIDCVAHDDAVEGDATRVLVRYGRVVDLGKGIEEWNAVETGIFWCTPRLFEAITPELRDGELGEVFAKLARNGDLDASDITGCAWIDIDTADDLRRAEVMLGAAPPRRGEVA